MAGLRFAFVFFILERLEHTKVRGLGAGARTGGRRPGAHLSPGARARAGAAARRARAHTHAPPSPRGAAHTAQRAIDDYSWMWQMKMRW